MRKSLGFSHSTHSSRYDAPTVPFGRIVSSADMSRRRSLGSAVRHDNEHDQDQADASLENDHSRRQRYLDMRDGTT